MKLRLLRDRTLAWALVVVVVGVVGVGGALIGWGLAEGIVERFRNDPWRFLLGAIAIAMLIWAFALWEKLPDEWKTNLVRLLGIAALVTGGVWLLVQL